MKAALHVVVFDASIGLGIGILLVLLVAFLKKVDPFRQEIWREPLILLALFVCTGYGAITHISRYFGY